MCQASPHHDVFHYALYFKKFKWNYIFTQDNNAKIKPNVMYDSAKLWKFLTHNCIHRVSQEIAANIYLHLSEKDRNNFGFFTLMNAICWLDKIFKRWEELIREILGGGSGLELMLL